MYNIYIMYTPWSMNRLFIDQGVLLPVRRSRRKQQHARCIIHILQDSSKQESSTYCLLCILFSFFWRLPEELHRRASGGFLSSYSGTFWSHFQANLRAKTYQNVSQTDVRNRRSEQPHKKEIPFFELHKRQ